jgi:hypothetical protein
LAQQPNSNDRYYFTNERRLATEVAKRERERKKQTSPSLAYGYERRRAAEEITEAVIEVITSQT